MTRIAAWIGLALLGAGFLACRARTTFSLAPEWVRLESENNIDGDEPTILMLGETHDNVAAQEHLADQLHRLIDERQIEAILVEGSEGDIDASQFIAQAAGLLPDGDREAYWRRQLQWGQLAGWEYAVLVRPQTPAFGVEDPCAQQRFVIQYDTPADEVKAGAGSAVRGTETLERAAAALEQAGVSIPGLRDALERRRVAVQGYLEAATRFGNRFQALTPQRLQEADLRCQLEPILKETGLAGLRGKKEDKDQVSQILQKVQEEKPDLFARFAGLTEKIQPLEQQLEASAKELEPDEKALGASERAANESYRDLANQLRAAAAAKWGEEAGARPAEIAASLRSVETFFGDELARLRQEAADPALAGPQLAERDAAMVSNTESYMQAHGLKRVALIVGSAHLADMAEKLKARGVSFVSGRLLPDDAGEAWEEKAWDRRREAALGLARGNKEPSALLSEAWRDRQLALLKDLGTPPGPGPAVSKDEDGHPRAVFRSSELPDQRVPRGSHVIGFGPVPGRADEVYENWDRNVAGDQVGKASDGTAEFVYGMFDVDDQGQRRYTLATSSGSHTLDEFKGQRPNGSSGSLPRYYVLLAEPDLVGSSSPLWVSLRDPGDGGTIKPPPPPAPPAAPSAGDGEEKKPDEQATDGGAPPPVIPPTTGQGSEEPPDPRWTVFLYDRDSEDQRPALLRTTDVERAREHLDKLAKQRPLEPSEVALLRDPSKLDEVYFAQEDGSHAGMVVLVASNTEELRAAVRRAGEQGKLRNKQVALITCGHLAKENAALRESVLAAGALMVWMPDRQITVDAGERLMKQVELTLDQARTNHWRPRDVNQLLEHAIADLHGAAGNDPVLAVLWESGAYVELRPPSADGPFARETAPGESFTSAG